MKLTLDERYSENIEKVYKITIRFIIETVIQGYEMASDREVNDNVAESKGASDTALGCPVSDHQEVNNLIQNMKTSVACTTSGSKCLPSPDEENHTKTDSWSFFRSISEWHSSIVQSWALAYFHNKYEPIRFNKTISFKAFISRAFSFLCIGAEPMNRWMLYFCLDLRA